MQVNAQIDKTSLMQTIKGLHAMGKASGMTVQFVCHDAMRLWAIRCMKFTAPWAAGSSPGNGKKQRATGEAAIAFDLFGGRKSHRGIIGRITPDIQAYTEFSGSKDLPNHNLIRLNSGAVFLVEKNLYDASGDQSKIRAHHLKYRGKNGRVTTAGRRDRNIGRWKSVDKLYVPTDAAAKYSKDVQSRVGSLKAGWLPAIYHYSMMSRGSNGNPPQWVKRHSGAGSFGGYIDASGNGSIFSENMARHRGAIRRSGVEKAMKVVESGMKIGKNGIPFRLQQLIKQWDSGQMPRANTRAS